MASDHHALEPGATATPALTNVRTTASTSKSVALSSQPFRFMDLPAELRVLVYRELVAVGKIFYTPDRFLVQCKTRFEDCNAYRRPFLAIMRVSKAVHHEAEHVYASQNLFVLPSQFQNWVPFDNPLLGRKILFSETAMDRIEHVSVEISSRDATDSIDLNRSYLDRVNQRDSSRSARVNAEEKLGLAHDLALGRYRDGVQLMAATLQTMPALQTIELDFTDAYCPMDCCRDVEVNGVLAEVLSEMNSVRVIGLRDRKEEATLMASWSDSMEDFWGTEAGSSVSELRRRCNVRFDSEDGLWEQWKMDGGRYCSRPHCDYDAWETGGEMTRVMALGH